VRLRIGLRSVLDLTSHIVESKAGHFKPERASRALIAASFGVTMSPISSLTQLDHSVR
jgi:hypothetical protein